MWARGRSNRFRLRCTGRWRRWRQLELQRAMHSVLWHLGQHLQAVSAGEEGGAAKKVVNCRGVGAREAGRATMLVAVYPAVANQQPSGTAKLQDSFALHAGSSRTAVGTGNWLRCTRLSSTRPQHVLCNLERSLKQS